MCISHSQIENWLHVLNNEHTVKQEWSADPNQKKQDLRIELVS